LGNVLLLVHFIISVTVTVAIVNLDGRIVLPDVSEDTYADMNFVYDNYGITSRLTVGKLTGIITVVLVLIRITTTSWSGVVAWRSTFALMEKDNIDLQQLNTLVTWKIFRPVVSMAHARNFFRISPDKSLQHHESTQSSSIRAFYIATVMLLMWPATLSAPLVTSAIEWLPAFIDAPEVPYMDTSGTGQKISLWSWREFVREQTANKAHVAGDAASIMTQITMSNHSMHTWPHFDLCRHFEIYPAPYTIHRPPNITFPCIETSSIQ
jgi:hypothetical protein